MENLVKWITKDIMDSPRKEKEKEILISFWLEFYGNYLDNKKKESDKESEKSRPMQYKESVLDMLHDFKKKKDVNDEDLRKLQLQIEDITMMFDEHSIHKSAPNIIKMLLSKKDICARDYLKARKLDKADSDLLDNFGHYTLEALIVYVLALVFNELEYSALIRVATLVERLESSVRRQATLMKGRENTVSLSTENENVNLSDKEKKKPKLEKMYPFGVGLMEFMEERKLIGFSANMVDSQPVKKKGVSYYLPKPLYVFCKFDLSLLPIKLNFPMVYPPIDWKSTCPPGVKPKNMSDLVGGYLCAPTGDIYDRYNLLSSGDINHFHITFGKTDKSENMCDVMNKLQRQAFQINNSFLHYIKEYENELINYGYLMPEFLSTMRIQDVYILLREIYIKNKEIHKVCSFSELIDFLSKNIQRSRYEQFLIKLADAYNGYKFYLPAFLDFRGRMYRSGILHFHERDLSRSLIIFANIDTETRLHEQIYNTLLRALPFHYRSFTTEREALNWMLKNSDNNNIKSNIPNNAQEAKRPFQLISYLTSLGIWDIKKCLPVTQDASASAYQIMSYFLLDKEMAMRTNLFPSKDGKINDIYSFILEELKEFIPNELEKNLSTIICDRLTRKLVKGIFMPIIYGKSLISTANDLKEHLSYFITHKECMTVASVCFKFWKSQYPGMECLIHLIRNIGWIASARESPVFYRVSYFSTVQDYMKMEAINIWVYDRFHKKRRRVTLRVPSSKRDRRKTEISTFVNFIHQKDAYIAMKVVEQMQELKTAPIYTVHDNYITTAEYCHFLPRIYTNVICDMGPPLSIINEFIYINVIKPIDKEESAGSIMDKFTHKIIPKEKLSTYLRKNIPKNISKRMVATWEKRISSTMHAYESYIRIVCGGSLSPGNNDYWKAHEKEWDKFVLKIKSGAGAPKYCVHY